MKVWMVVCLTLVMGMSPWTAAASVTVTDHRGVAVRLNQPVERIVSLMPSLTEAVCALGECARLVGTDRHSNSPGEVASLPKLGSMGDVSLERLIALKPDLVVMTPSSRLSERLNQLGVPVLVIRSDTQAQVRDGLRMIALALGKPERAEALWSGIQAELAAARAQVPVVWAGARVYFEVDVGLYAAGPRSFIGETLSALGLNNIVSDDMGPFPSLNPEFVVLARPDLLMGGARQMAALPQRPGWGQMPAVLSLQVCGFTPPEFEVLTRPGPRMGQGARLIVACLRGLDARQRGAR